MRAAVFVTALVLVLLLAAFVPAGRGLGQSVPPYTPYPTPLTPYPTQRPYCGVGCEPPPTATLPPMTPTAVSTPFLGVAQPQPVIGWGDAQVFMPVIVGP